MKIKNIVLDMGGVLLDIDYHRTRDAFISLGVTNFNDFYSQTHANPLFADFERGLVEPEDFREQLRQLSGLSLADEEIDAAWNAMLGQFHVSSLAYVETLKNDYPIYLLSNTNVIHYGALLNIHFHQFGNSLFDERFDKAYFSHRINQRKPDTAAFTIVLEENNLNPAETLFVDDTHKNLPPAEALNMQVIYLQNGRLLGDALREKLALNH
jgi:glucose-1-phosphatase